MLRDLRRGAAAGLVMHKIDRSARNLKDWATISELSDAGVDVYFATESLDFRSRGGRLSMLLFAFEYGYDPHELSCALKRVRPCTPILERTSCNPEQLPLAA